jgi:hypothetical protein
VIAQVAGRTEPDPVVRVQAEPPETILPGRRISHTTMQTDADLIRAARSDPAAFAELYRHACAIDCYLRDRFALLLGGAAP